MKGVVAVFGYLRFVSKATVLFAAGRSDGSVVGSAHVGEGAAKIG